MEGLNNWKYIIILMLCLIFKSCEGVPMYGEGLSSVYKNTIDVIIDMEYDYNDEPVPNYFKNALAQAITDDSTSKAYNDAMGEPQLRQSIAKFYARAIGRQLDWKEEVITTVGATEALASAIRAISKSGQEWILIQPFFNMFKTAIELAYCVPRYANLKPRDHQDNSTASNWEIDRAEIKSLINAKTRGIIFNNPNNPLGKCYTREELDFIAQLAKDHKLIVLADEVHEFTGDSMIKMASLPGMFERTLTIGSASKAFCIPGWRVGWIFGPADFIKQIHDVHKNTVNFITPAQQRAVATVLEDEFKNFGTPESYLFQNLANIKRKRDFVVQAFRQAGMLPIVPCGGYCMLAIWPRWSNLKTELLKKNSTMNDTCVNSLKEITRVQTFPAVRFYGDLRQFNLSNALRFCYHKTNETLQDASEKLSILNSSTEELARRIDMAYNNV